jgi:zinc/manganese transport system substrate-binding protein
MKPLKILALSLLALGAAGTAPAHAKVSVMAANQDLAWVTKTLGGNQVDVDYFARGGQDPHHIEPRPSQVIKLAHADMLVRIGLDLDLWLDPLIQSAGNAKIATGGKGYVDASRGVRVLEVPSGKLDPSKGDIHVYGNPHYLFAPTNMRPVARNIADGLERADPSGKAAYEANFQALMTKVGEGIKRWNARMAADRGKPVVTYHKSLVYFLNEFGLKEAGNVEPRPGLEPSVGHVSTLAAEMKQNGVKVILAENFRPRRFSDLLAQQSGAKVVVIPGGIGAEKGVDDYFSFMDTIIDRVAGSL